ncbi:hypothetical protein Tco_1494367 [Tanacetum coccineum]
MAQSGESYELWPSYDPYNDECDGGDSNDMSNIEEKKYYWTCMNDDERIDVPTIGRRIKRYLDLENFGDEKRVLIQELIKDRLNDNWYSHTPDDDDELDCLVDYLELQSYGGFIDTKDEAYKERMCKLLGMTYKKPPPITIEKFEITRYMVSPRERYAKIKVVVIDEMPSIISNVAMIRVGLMEEINKE